MEVPYVTPQFLFFGIAIALEEILYRKGGFLKKCHFFFKMPLPFKNADSFFYGFMEILANSDEFCSVPLVCLQSWCVVSPRSGYGLCKGQ